MEANGLLEQLLRIANVAINNILEWQTLAFLDGGRGEEEEKKKKGVREGEEPMDMAREAYLELLLVFVGSQNDFSTHGVLHFLKKQVASVGGQRRLHGGGSMERAHHGAEQGGRHRAHHGQRGIGENVFRFNLIEWIRSTPHFIPTNPIRSAFSLLLVETPMICVFS